LAWILALLLGWLAGWLLDWVGQTGWVVGLAGFAGLAGLVGLAGLAGLAGPGVGSLAVCGIRLDHQHVLDSRFAVCLVGWLVAGLAGLAGLASLTGLAVPAGLAGWHFVCSLCFGMGFGFPLGSCFGYTFKSWMQCLSDCF